MIKNTTMALLILIVLAIPTFIYFVKFNHDSFIGETAKAYVLKKQNIVRLLNMNEPGDARYSYFDSKNESVTVSVVSVNHKEPNKDVDLWVKDMVLQTLGKGVNVGLVKNLAYINTKLLADIDLNEIRKKATSLEPADLYIIYASSYAEKETAVGLVLHRDTIFIFRDAIEDLSERESVRDVLEQTTIMHEWGHLLGMDHVNDGACIMDEKVDVYDHPPIGADLPTKYCQKELQELRNLY